MGIGTRFDEISTDGVTWDKKKHRTSWLVGSASLESSGSYNGKGGYGTLVLLLHNHLTTNQVIFNGCNESL